MKNSTAQSSHNASEKRDPGFVKIRRGLLEHWPEMSVNARSLYIWLHLKAYFLEPKRGWVEASFDDMARGNGWSLKTLQRAIEELEAKPYIEIERAANQYALTRVRILKYDPEESSSAMDKSDQSSTVAVDCAVVSGVDKFDLSTVHSKPASTQRNKDLQAPKNAVAVKKEKNEKLDAVRRPVDAEHRIARRKSLSPSERRKKLEKRLTESVRKNKSANNCELMDDEREAFRYIGYKPRDPISLPCGFVWLVVDVYEAHKGEALTPGNMCSKIIDRCMSEQESCKTLGSDPSEYYWPPDFQDHRDRFRAQEREQQRRTQLTEKVGV